MTQEGAHVAQSGPVSLPIQGGGGAYPLDLEALDLDFESNPLYVIFNLGRVQPRRNERSGRSPICPADKREASPPQIRGEEIRMKRMPVSPETVKELEKARVRFQIEGADGAGGGIAVLPICVAKFVEFWSAARAAQLLPLGDWLLRYLPADPDEGLLNFL